MLYSLPRLISDSWHQLNHFSFPLGESLTFWLVIASFILVQNVTPAIVKRFRKQTRPSSRIGRETDRKESAKATYTEAEALARINSGFSGISKEMGDIGMAIQQADDKNAAKRRNANPPQR